MIRNFKKGKHVLFARQEKIEGMSVTYMNEIVNE